MYTFVFTILETGKYRTLTKKRFEVKSQTKERMVIVEEGEEIVYTCME